MFYKNTAKDWEKKKKRKRGKPLGIYKCSENFYLKPIEKKKKKGGYSKTFFNEEIIGREKSCHVDQCNFQVLRATKI